jgi:hypothetical protein
VLARVEWKIRTERIDAPKTGSLYNNGGASFISTSIQHFRSSSSSFIVRGRRQLGRKQPKNNREKNNNEIKKKPSKNGRQRTHWSCTGQQKEELSSGNERESEEGGGQQESYKEGESEMVKKKHSLFFFCCFSLSILNGEVQNPQPCVCVYTARACVWEFLISFYFRESKKVLVETTLNRSRQLKMLLHHNHQKMVKNIWHIKCFSCVDESFFDLFIPFCSITYANFPPFLCVMFPNRVGRKM